MKPPYGVNMNKEEVLNQCTVVGNVVKLPIEKIDSKVYAQVKKALTDIGGSWKGGKIFGFVFTNDPTDLLAEVAGGKKRNIKKEFQFYATPDELADELVEFAEIKDGMTILEPSAGQGAVIKAVYRAFPRTMKGGNDNSIVTVDYCELMEDNQNILSKEIDGGRTSFIGADFLKLKNSTKKYDRIIANPPFNKNQDITHIREMYNHLKKGGRLVSIASIHWKLSKNKTETEFKNWLKKVQATIHDVEKGRFKSSGTGTATCIIIINK